MIHKSSERPNFPLSNFVILKKDFRKIYVLIVNVDGKFLNKWGRIILYLIYVDKKASAIFLHHTLMTFHSTSCVHLMRSPIEYMAIRSKLKYLFWKNKNNKNEMIELASGFLMTTKQMRRPRPLLDFHDGGC